MFKNITKFLFTCLLLVLTVATSYGRKIYVANYGSDSYTITQAQNPNTPWATISKVQSSLSSITSGDSILFRKGDVFVGTLSMYGKTNLYFGTFGTGAKPLFWGTGSAISSLVTLTTCSNIKFDGWNISDTTISPTDRTVQAKIRIVFTMQTSSQSNTVKNCTMDRIGYGIYITSSSRGQLIDSNDIGNLRMIRNTPGGDDDYGGVPMQISSRNNTVTNNYLHDCWSQSYDYGYDGGGIEFFEEGDTIMNNIVAYNTFYDNNGCFEHGSSSDGVANNPIMNNKFYYNKIINCSSLFYINNNGQYKTVVSNIQFYNNVIIQTVASRTGNLTLGSMAINDARTGIVVFKNNIFQVSNGAAVVRSGQWTAGQLTHTNNIYKLSNGSVTNFTLDPTEIATSGAIWVNTSNTNPIFWDFHLTSTSLARGTGVNVGLTRDFEGNPISGTPDMGIYQYIVPVPPACTFTYNAWSTCSNGTQTRTYSVTPTGCGVPPTDSILRNCTVTCASFQYTPWTACTNGFQSRDYTGIPGGCAGEPPMDSVMRACVPPACPYTVSTTFFKNASCLNRSDGYATITVTCGGPSYTYRLTNLRTGAILNTITSSSPTQNFYFLGIGRYRVDVTSSGGKTSYTVFTISAVRRRNC